MKKLLLVATCTLVTACAQGPDHYSIDNPHDISSAIGRRALRGALVAPGVIDVRITEHYIGQPVRDPDKRIVGYVTGMVACSAHRKGCTTFDQQPPSGGFLME